MSKLEGVSLPYRTCSIAKNDYDNNDQYNTGHPDALSTGDEEGKSIAFHVWPPLLVKLF